MADLPSEDLRKAAHQLGIPPWGSILIGFLFLIIGGAFWGYLHMWEKLGKIESAVRALASKQPSDVNGLVRDLLAQAKKKSDESVQQRVATIQGRLDKLDSGLKSSNAAQKKLEQKVEGQQAIAKLVDARRVFAVIRGEIDLAQRGGTVLPEAQVVDYRSAVKGLPASARGYWQTVAAIVNYQSLLNQQRGRAPDPGKVARSCPLLTNSGNVRSFGNYVSGGTAKGCIVDLGTNVLDNLTFVDCVIRWESGPVGLSNVRFINCRFIIQGVLDAPGPVGVKLLQALLDSGDQTTVSVS